MVRASSPASGLLSKPAFEFGSKPEFDAPAAEFNDRAGHVGVAALIQTDAVAVRKTEKVGDTVSINEVFGGNERAHGGESTLVDGSVRPRC